MATIHTNSTHRVDEVYVDAEPAKNAWAPNTPGGVSDYGALPGAPTLDTDPDLEIGDIWNGYTLIIKDESGPQEPSNLGWELSADPQDTLEGADANPDVGDTFLDYTYQEITERVPGKAYYHVIRLSDEAAVARFDVYTAADKQRQSQRAIQRADWLEANPDGGVVVNPEPPADIFS